MGLFGEDVIGVLSFLLEYFQHYILSQVATQCKPSAALHFKKVYQDIRGSAGSGSAPQQISDKNHFFHHLPGYAAMLILN